MINDTSELISFTTFANDGIITTDTFNTWRKKDNGVVQQLNLFEANSLTQAINVDNTTGVISLKIGSVTSDHLAIGSVTTDKIPNLAITDIKLANNSVTEQKINVSAITSAKLANNSVVLGKIAPDAITTISIQDNSVTTNKLAANAVTESKILNGSVSRDKIANDAIDGDKIAANSISSAELAANSIQTSHVNSSAIINRHLAANAVTELTIADNSVTANKIAAGALNSAKIAAGAVTADKMSGNQTGTAPVYGARAWVTFDGNNVSLVSGEYRCNIYGSGNVSKVVRTDASYFIHIGPTPMIDVNYAVCATAGGGWHGNEGTFFAGELNSTPRTVSTFEIGIARATDGSASGNVAFTRLINVVVFR